MVCKTMFIMSKLRPITCIHPLGVEKFRRARAAFGGGLGSWPRSGRRGAPPCPRLLPPARAGIRGAGTLLSRDLAAVPRGAEGRHRCRRFCAQGNRPSQGAGWRCTSPVPSHGSAHAGALHNGRRAGTVSCLLELQDHHATERLAQISAKETRHDTAWRLRSRVWESRRPEVDFPLCRSPPSRP